MSEEKWKVDKEFLQSILKKSGEALQEVEKIKKKVLEHDQYIQTAKLNKELRDIQSQLHVKDNTIKMEVLFNGIKTNEEANRRGLNFQNEVQYLINKYNVKKLKIDAEI